MKPEKILICYNQFNDKKEFKFPCHAQIYGEINEIDVMLKKLCNMINNARKYDQAWIECYFLDNIGKTLTKSPFIIVEKEIKPSYLIRKIYLNE